MATTAVEQIKVKGLSKYGFQLENGEYIGFSKNLKDAEKGKVVPGAELSVEMYRADSGKGYVNKVLASVLTPVVPSLVAPVFNKTPLVSEVTAKVSVKPSNAVKNIASETMSKADWASKDRSMMIGGLSHDAAVLAAAAATANVSMDRIVDDYKFALAELVKIREAVK